MKNFFKKFLRLFTVAALVLSTVTIPGMTNLSDLPGKVSAAEKSVASVDFSDGSVKTDHAKFLNITDSADEPYTEVAEIGGSKCRKIPASKYMYMSFDRSTVAQTERNIMIDVTFWDDNNNSIWFNYNSTSNNHATADFSRTASGDWATVTVVLTDAEFKGGMRDGNDIRIGYGSSDVYIKSVSVSLGKLDPESEPIPKTPSSDSEFKNRSFAGYQMWHRAGNNASDWVHWSYGKFPSPGLQKNVNVCSWPDVSVYPKESLYQTGFKNLGSGEKSVLYNSTDPKIISTHFDLMKKGGIDGVSIQRFVGGIGRTITKTSANYLDYAKQNAERTGRLFYVGYDLNGAGDDILECFKNDWVYEIEQTRALTSSPNYATVDGKPVVQIWGIGMDFGISEEKMNKIIDFFHSRGCYIIAGAPRDWREAKLYSIDLFKKIDCISPWTVGAYGDISGADWYYNNLMIDDVKFCRENNMDYLPVCFAGSGNWVSESGNFSETDRLGGKLLWKQVRNVKSLDLSSVYIAMFDEFEENTNILNSARDYFDIPVDEYFETLAKNGVWVSSDYYLRLTGAASKLLRGEIANTEEIPVEYSEGPLYFRNSFEYRDTVLFRSNVEKPMTLQIDPCLYKDETVKEQNVTNASVTDEKLGTIPQKTGLYAAKLSGSGKANADYLYKTNETKITVKSGMTLSFARYAANENGKHTAVDLIFSDGTRMSELLPEYSAEKADGKTGEWENVTYTIGKDSLVGKTVTGIALSYKSAEAGDFTAYFDDVIIEDGEVSADPCDLYVSDAMITPSNTADGDKITVKSTVRNVGNADSVGKITVQFKVDGKILDTVTYDGTVKPGKMVTVSSDKTMSVFFGAHTVSVTVKTDQSETDTANNIIKKRFAVQDT